MIKQLKLHIWILSACLLGGCASSIPKNIGTTPEPDLSYSAIRAGNSENTLSSVRWGGEIITVENEAGYTLVEILSQELGYQGRPIEQDEYQGRFIARVNEFLDPEYYEKGRKLTVYGKLSGDMQKDISAHTYTYPVVEVEEYYLWPNIARFDRGYNSPQFYPYHWRSPFIYPFYGPPWRYGFYYW